MTSTKKRVLIITPGYLPLLGGMEEMCYNLAQEYIRQGHVVEILTERTNAEFAKNEVLDGATVYRLPVNRKSPFGLIPLSVRLILFLLNRQSKYDFCIIRTLTLHGAVTGFLKGLGILRLPTFITTDTIAELPAIRKSRLRSLLVWALSRHDYLNSICQKNYQDYQSLGFPQEKLTKIYNGIDTSEYASATYPSHVATFLFLGQLLKTKGIYEMVKAFGMLIKTSPDVRLVIAGDGPERDNLLRTIDTMGISKYVTYLGRIDRAERKAFFAQGDCLLFPSYAEGFGLVVTEAALHKRLIITTDVADIKALYGDNVSYCKKENALDLAAQMTSLLSNYVPGTVNYDLPISNLSIQKTTSEIYRLFL